MIIYDGVQSFMTQFDDVDYEIHHTHDFVFERPNHAPGGGPELAPQMEEHEVARRVWHSTFVAMACAGAARAGRPPCPGAETRVWLYDFRLRRVAIAFPLPRVLSFFHLEELPLPRVGFAGALDLQKPRFSSGF